MFFMPLVIIVLILLQFDDPLAPEAQALVEHTIPPSESPAYLYLLGIDAPPEQEPADHGERLLAYSRQQDDLVEKNPATTESAPWPKYQALPRPEGKLFCRWSESDCRVRILSRKHQAPELSATDRVLLDRYRTFMAMDRFRTLSKPSLHEPLPSFHYLVSGHRLVMLNLLEKADEGSPADAIHQLADNLARVRGHLADADTLIGKLVYLALMSESLDVLSSLLAEHGFELAPELRPMSTTERDFALPMAREFAIGYHLFQSMDRHPGFFHTTSIAGASNEGILDTAHTPGWWVRAIFKPNMTSNSVLPVYLQSIQLSQVAPADYPHAMGKADEVSVKTNWLRNSSGTILAGVGGPHYEDYVAEAFNLHGKLSLLRQIIDLSGLPFDLETLENPLASGGDNMYWDSGRRQLCLAGPGEDDRRFRCLVVQPDNVQDS